MITAKLGRVALGAGRYVHARSLRRQSDQLPDLGRDRATAGGCRRQSADELGRCVGQDRGGVGAADGARGARVDRQRDQRRRRDRRVGHQASGRHDAADRQCGTQRRGSYGGGHRDRRRRERDRQCRRHARRVVGDGGSAAIVGITGELIMLDGAQIDASGATGGGNIAVGYSGEGASRVIGADRIIVKPSTMLKADALESGDGGQIVFWSNLATDFYGDDERQGRRACRATAGSWKFPRRIKWALRASADASAANGAVGQLLLDPKNITISTVFGGIGRGGQSQPADLRQSVDVVT